MPVICHEGAPRRAFILWPRVSQAHCLAAACKHCCKREFCDAVTLVSPERTPDYGKSIGSTCHSTIHSSDTRYDLSVFYTWLIPGLYLAGLSPFSARARESRRNVFVFCMLRVAGPRVSGVLLSKETAGPNTTVETALRDSR